MARFEDSPGLFGLGIGSGTYGNCICEWCGTEYEDREDEEGEPLNGNESISLVWFGDKQICDCCFEKVEDAVLLCMDDIIPWFIKILAGKRNEVEVFEDMLKRLKAAIA